MTSEQLQQARGARWRQVGNPLLTAEEAREWIEGVGLCLFAPRRAQFAAAAPSLVEAAAGSVTDTPTRETIEHATALLKRLAAESAVVPLNLLGMTGVFGAGAAGFGGADVPDFVASRETLPYVFSLIGGRNWKSGPGGKASPLMVEVWTLLGREGALTAAEVQTALGREVTEGAALRALGELWHGLRVIPAYNGDEMTRWELTQARFEPEMTASQKVAQTTALSALVSLYLESVIAASSEDIETFLSPLTARSRVREVVNGLQATRQLTLVSVGAHPLLHVTGSLPEMAEPENAETPAAGAAEEKPRRVFERRPPFEKRKPGFVRGTDRERRSGFGRKPQRDHEGGSRPERKSFERKPFERKGREGFDRGERKPYERKERFAARGDERLFGPKREGERRPYVGKPRDGEDRPYGKRPFDKRVLPFEEKTFGKRQFGKEWTGEWRSPGVGGKFPPRRFGAGSDSSRGARPARSWQEREGGGREGERGAGKPNGEKRFGGKKFDGPKKFGSGRFDAGKRSAGRSLGSGKTFGGPKQFSGRGREEGGKRPFFRERPEREREARDGEHPSGKREFHAERGEGARPAKREAEWKPKPGGFAKGGKPGFKGVGKGGFKKPGFGRPAFGKPRSGKSGMSREGKPFGKTEKPFGKPGKEFGKGKPKPGGFGPPRKRKEKERGDAE